jgi:diguanylate cyclase (GGDEF)-like protein
MHQSGVDERPRILTRRSLRARLRRESWMVLGALAVIVGAGSAAFGGVAMARNDAATSERSAHTEATQLASSLTLTLQRKSDLIAAAGAFLADRPSATNAQFGRWFSAIGGFGRYPGITGLVDVVLISAARLPTYAASEMAHPTGPLVPPGVFRPIPAGNRAEYCFLKVAVEVSLVVPPAAEDYCASPTSLLSDDLSIRDSGVEADRPVTYGSVALLAIVTPIYRSFPAPMTVSGRRESFLGFLATSIVPSTILDSALGGHAHTALTLSYGKGASEAVYHAGSAPSGAPSISVGLHNGWTLRIFASVASDGVFANGNSLELLLFGGTLSLLLALLVCALVTGRSRALRLVGERTDELSFQAMHDSLTGLPNRALIYDRIGLMLARARRNHTLAAVMYLDIDNFKDVNDSLGHAAGDHLLKAVGTRLSAVLREDETVGRIGGDEFIVLLDGAALDAGAEVVAERILDVLSAPFVLPEAANGIVVTSSIGIVVGTTSTPDEMLRDADIALYQAKGAGKHQSVMFAPLMQEIVARRHELEIDLQAAVDEHQFFLLYQPTIDLKSNLVSGVEALLRWHHPTKGVILPTDFVPLLETSGLIVTVGAWVLEEACRQGAIWHAMGHHFSVAVNVSIRQIELERIVDDVSSALRTSGFDPTALILELTETALMHDIDPTIVRLMQLRALGIRFAVDDFGTGYSSLAYLRKFPLDVLKIDRSFVSGIATSTESAAIVHALVGLGQTLGLETIAEGVEDEEQRRILQRENVDTGQGFLFARPLDATAVELLARDINFRPNEPESASANAAHHLEQV